MPAVGGHEAPMEPAVPPPAPALVLAPVGGESILAGVFWFVPFRGPFWQKGPQGVRRPRAFWPECFGLRAGWAEKSMSQWLAVVAGVVGVGVGAGVVATA